MGDKVLIVEDEPTLPETLEYNLTRQGYEVYTASTGHVHPLTMQAMAEWGIDISRQLSKSVDECAMPNLTWLSPCAIMRPGTVPSGWGQGK